MTTCTLTLFINFTFYISSSFENFKKFIRSNKYFYNHTVVKIIFIFLIYQNDHFENYLVRADELAYVRLQKKIL